MQVYTTFLITALAALVVNFNLDYVCAEVRVKFTNLKCIELCKEITTFKQCKLKVVGRDKVSLHVHAVMHQLPVQKVMFNGALFRKGNNGFRPFMYNTTMDLCEFFKNLNRHVFWKIAYLIAKPYTNANHTCPYNHDIIVDGIVLNEDMFKLIPFPRGDYMLQLQYAVDKRYVVKVQVHMARLDDDTSHEIVRKPHGRFR